MCDNGAVSWSEYSSHNSRVEYEVRQNISQELLKHIRFLEKTETPECYIQGLERARILVLNNISTTNDTEEVETQEKLF